MYLYVRKHLEVNNEEGVPIYHLAYQITSENSLRTPFTHVHYTELLYVSCEDSAHIQLFRIRKWGRPGFEAKLAVLFNARAIVRRNHIRSSMYMYVGLEISCD